MSFKLIVIIFLSYLLFTNSQCYSSVSVLLYVDCKINLSSFFFKTPSLIECKLPGWCHHIKTTNSQWSKEGCWTYTFDCSRHSMSCFLWKSWVCISNQGYNIYFFGFKMRGVMLLPPFLANRSYHSHKGQVCLWWRMNSLLFLGRSMRGRNLFCDGG